MTAMGYSDWPTPVISIFICALAGVIAHAKIVVKQIAINFVIELIPGFECEFYLALWNEAIVIFWQAFCTL